MKASELRGRAVISLAEAHKVGEVENVLLDPAENQVIGFRVKHGVFGAARLLPAAHVQSIGPDAVMMPNQDALDERSSPSDARPLTDLDNLSKIRVVSESGALVGNLGDVEIDSQAMSITAYYLSGSLWDHLTQGNKTFASAPGLRFGGELLIIPDAVAHALMGGASASANPPEAAPGASDMTAAPNPPETLVMPIMQDNPPVAPPPAVADAAPTPYPPPVDTALDPPAPADDKARGGAGPL